MATSVSMTNANALLNATDIAISTNVTIEALNDAETAKYLGVLIFCVTVMVIGIVGNLLVLIIYKTKFKRSSARTYILALAMADLSVCLIGIPYHVLDLTMLLAYNHTPTCKVLSFLIGSCTNSSIFILLVVGLDRFLKVCRPLKKQIIDFGDRRACLIAVAFAIVLSIPNAVLYGRSSVETEIEGLYGVECFINDDYVESMFAVAFMGLNILIFIASLLFLVVIYGFICKRIYRQDKNDVEINLNKMKAGCCNCLKQQEFEEDDSDNEINGDFNSREETVALSGEDNCDKNVSKSNDESVPLAAAEKGKPSENKDKSRRKESAATRGKSTFKDRSRQTVSTKPSTGMVRHVQHKEKHTRKITLMMLAITAVFAISYLPFIIICILTALDESYWDDMGHFESIISDLILRIYLINNVANPIIYSFMDLRFRKEVIAVLKRLCGFGSADRKSFSVMSSRHMTGTRHTYTTRS